jgi:hypothetical protein
MEYYNIIIFVLIFLIVLVSFYFIINNLGIKSTDSSNIYIDDNKSNNDLEKKISMLKSELYLIKNKINLSSGEITNTNTNTNTNPNTNSNPNTNLSQISSSSISSSNQNNLTSVSVPLKNDSGSINEIIIEQDNQVLNTSIPNNLSPNNLGPINKPPPIIYDPIANYDIAKLTDPLVDPRGRTSADQIPTPQVAMQFNFPTQGVLDKYHRVGLLIAIDNNIKKEKKEMIELPYSISDKSNLSSDSNSISGSEFVWNGPSKTNINKRKKRYVVMESNDSSNDSSSKSYKGVDMKENFDVDSNYDSNEYFGNIDKSITNVYNVYSNNNDNNILELIGKKITDNWYKYFTSITMGNKIIKVVVHNKNRKELYCGDIIYIPEIKRTYRVKIDPMDMIDYNPYLF